MANIEVPLTIVTAPGDNYITAVAVGDQVFYPPASQQNSYWFSVYDRYTLKQVYSQLQVADGDTVPADLAGKFNTPQYFLAVSTTALRSMYIPAGPLYKFLVDNGAGIGLKRLTQALQQFGCGSLATVTYAMAGVLGPGPTSHPIIEVSDFLAVRGQWLEATLVGVQVGSQTIYTPVPLTMPQV